MSNTCPWDGFLDNAGTGDLAHKKARNIRGWLERIYLHLLKPTLDLSKFPFFGRTSEKIVAQERKTIVNPGHPPTLTLTHVKNSNNPC
jgi:hypothetical protein